LSSMALMPDPPISMESVTGEGCLREALRTALGLGAAAMATLGLIRVHCTEKQGIGNRVQVNGETK